MQRLKFAHWNSERMLGGEGSRKKTEKQKILNVVRHTYLPERELEGDMRSNMGRTLPKKILYMYSKKLKACNFVIC